MEILIFLLFLLLVAAGLVAGFIFLIGSVARNLISPRPIVTLQTSELLVCPKCDFHLRGGRFCGRCGWQAHTDSVPDLLKDLDATRRQIERFYREGVLAKDVFEQLSARINSERRRIEGGEKISPPEPSVVSPPPSVVPSSTSPEHAPTAPPPSTTTPPIPASEPAYVSVVPSESEVVSQTAEVTPERLPPPPPRRPFTEVLNAFMEQSNIRWGEIIGGLLIIGCSTALVVSLWAQISAIPVLQFLIFTSITAALFGIGLYTEHRWKLPTTSRGILTIATLLVPLNFLAIAAVSAAESSGALVILSELLAPAVFLCLVYFGGRVIAPLWPHLLAAGVLGSSVGQLLVRHFVHAEIAPSLLVFFGAFPFLIYVGTVAWMLRQALRDREIDESESSAIFTTLGALTFAAALPFGLLLYKAGPVGITMMYLAPLVTLGGIPLLATGTLLWKRVVDKELVVARTSGTSIAILGMMIVMLGMLLAWPNPASIVPAALLNFAVFTAVAVLFRLQVAHVVAALSLILAYVVLFHVADGRVAWQNLRVTSLLKVTLSASSGQALTALFILFVAAAEWLRNKQQQLASQAYLWSSGIVAALSLLLVTAFGLGIEGDPDAVWSVFAILALGSFWIGSRWQLAPLGWVGSALLLAALAQAFGPWMSLEFPWQTAFIVHAGICAIGALISYHYRDRLSILVSPLNISSLFTSFAAVASLFQAKAWQTTPVQAERVFSIAAIWLMLLWINRSRHLLFAAFQIALTAGVVLSIKATLQQYEWYAYLPHAFVHPRALQIQGTFLVLLALGWTALRLYFRRYASEGASADQWTSAAAKLLLAPRAVDRMISWGVLAGFVLLAFYGAIGGVKQELTALGVANPVWDIAGYPHQHALGLGSWILLPLIVVLMLANSWERRRSDYLLGALLAMACAVPLLAGRWEPQVAVASAARWFAVLFLIGLSLPLVYRDGIAPYLKSFGWPEWEVDGAEVARHLRIFLLMVTFSPLLALTLYPALRAINYLPVHGPAGGFFAYIGDNMSYTIPLVLAAGVLIGFSVSERLPGYAFAAGLLLNLAVTMSYLLSVVAVGGSMNRVVLVRAIQLNAITSALYAFAWLSTRARWIQRTGSALADRLLGLQAGISAALLVVLILPVAGRLVLRPDLVGAGTFEVGSLRGWIAFALSAGAVAWFGKIQSRRFSIGTLSLLLLAVGALAAFTIARLDAGYWTSYYTLMLAAVLTAWLVARVSPEKHFKAEQLSRATVATLVGAFAVFLALRAAPADLSGTWWPVACLLSMSTLAALLNWETLKRSYLYAAGLLLNTAVTIWWVKRDAFDQAFDVLLQINLVVLSLASILWLTLELRARRLSKGKPVNQNTLNSFHNVAAVTSFLALATIIWNGLASQLLGTSQFATGFLTWLVLGGTAALLFATLWDREAGYSVALLYLVGLMGGALALNQSNLLPTRFVSAAVVFMGLYTFAAVVLWRQRATLLEWATRLNIPLRIESSKTELKWLSVFTIAITSVLVLLSYWIDLRFLDLSSRVTAALVVMLQTASFAMLAAGRLRPQWLRAAIIIFVVGAVLFGWAWLVPGVTGTWLNRSVVLMVAMFGLTALYALSLNEVRQRKPEWTNAARTCVPWIAGTGLAALMFALATEVFYQLNFGAVRVNTLSQLTIGLTLAGGSIICVLFALSAEHDPLEMSESGRMRYVYLAEIMLALLFLHIRLTMPWLFTGFFTQYWPVVVMLIAYTGVIASEALKRQGLIVLAQPLERTGVFLPLLPVLGFWLAQSRVDFSVLLFVVGGLYGLLSVLRRSFIFGLLAALAGNAGLWYFLHRTEAYGLFEHPQLWFIPVALSVLLAAYLNRADFTEEQLTGIRYLSLVTIYASSTADIFINGVAESPWLPVILASLSLCGVFAGIIFRIRGLLLMGAVFLLLAIVTMIYYASVNFGWTWLWYIAGIVTGATIIFMFALFEKKRNEVLRMVDGFKEWQR